MKRSLLCRILSAALFIIAASVGLSSCTGGDYWYDEPGYSTGTDSRLNGYWMLVQYNSEPVYQNDANYMYFNGNGYGYYYYLDNGYRRREQLRYWCQLSNTGASNYQINIQYQYSSPVTTSYWFTHGNNTLWMQWQTAGGRVQTYVYDRVNYAPW